MTLDPTTNTDRGSREWFRFNHNGPADEPESFLHTRKTKTLSLPTGQMTVCGGHLGILADLEEEAAGITAAATPFPPRLSSGSLWSTARTLLCGETLLGEIGGVCGRGSALGLRRTAACILKGGYARHGILVQARHGRLCVLIDGADRGDET